MGNVGKEERKGYSTKEIGELFERKTGEIFRLMDFEVEYDCKIAGNQIDIFIKKKKSFTNKYEYYICECKNWENNSVGVEVVHKTFAVREAVRNQFKVENKGTDCEAIIVTQKGFTHNAQNNARYYGIILSKYGELLARLMDFDSYLGTLVQRFAGSNLDHLFVLQDVIPEQTLETIGGFDFVEQWLKEPQRKHFSLLGDYGTGKTSFVKKLAYEMAKKHLEKPGGSRIPFLVDLGRCKRAISLENLIHQELVDKHIHPPNESIFLKLLAEGMILLIFDAFDEMATKTDAQLTLDNFKQLNSAVVGQAKVLLTSRTHYFRDQSEVKGILEKQQLSEISYHASMLLREISGKGEYEIVHLKEFSDEQVASYLEKAIPEEAIRREVADKISFVYNLCDLAARPVLLDMMVKTLPRLDQTDNAGTFNVVHLYEAYTEYWMQRQDHRLKITGQGKRDLVEGMALAMWQSGKTAIHYTDLAPVIRSHLKDKILTQDDLETADYEVRTASFLVRDNDGNYAFAHQSFKEFFLARKLLREFEEGRWDHLNMPLLSKEVVFFLCYMVDDDQQLLFWTRKILENGTTVIDDVRLNGLHLFYTVLRMTYLGEDFSLTEEVGAMVDSASFKGFIRGFLPHALCLKGVSLAGWRMPGMVFQQTDFSDSSLVGSVFSDADFLGSRFVNTKMEEADFSGCLFKNIRFERVKAWRCYFKDSRFSDCEFCDCDFIFSNFMDTSFQNCWVEGNDFTGAGFYRSDFNPEDHKKNTYYGIGMPGTKVVELVPQPVGEHGDWIRSVAVSSDGRFIVSSGDDRTLKLWDMYSGRLIRSIVGHEGVVSSVKFSPDNRWMVSGSYDHSMKLWDVEGVFNIAIMNGHTDWVKSICFSPDNQWVVSGSSDHTLKVWDVKTARNIGTMKGHQGTVNSVAICSNGRMVISGSSDKTIKLWGLESNNNIATLNGHESAVISVAISPDNKRLASGSYDRTIIIWNVEDGRIISTMEGHKKAVTSVCFTSDSLWLVSGSSDSTIKIWDVENGRNIATMEGHKRAVNSVCLTSDNKRVVSGSDDHTVKVWDMKSGSMLYNTHSLLDIRSVTIFANNKNLLDGKALDYLQYADRLAVYPAKDLSELRREGEI